MKTSDQEVELKSKTVSESNFNNRSAKPKTALAISKLKVPTLTTDVDILKNIF